MPSPWAVTVGGAAPSARVISKSASAQMRQRLRPEGQQEAERPRDTIEQIPAQPLALQMCPQARLSSVRFPVLRHRIVRVPRGQQRVAKRHRLIVRPLPHVHAPPDHQGAAPPAVGQRQIG